MLFKKRIPFSLVEISLYFLPLSLIAGSLVVNLNILVFLTFGLAYLAINKIKISFNISNILLFLFFVFVIFSSYLNLEVIGLNNFIKSFLLLKFFFLYLIVEILIKEEKINFKFFFYICLVLITLLSLDLLLQFFYGKNILGYEPWEGRITGIFEHEAIAGAYLQKIFIFSLAGVAIIFNQKNSTNFLLSTLLLIIIILGSYVASNRISFLILLVTIFILIAFFSIFRKRLIISLFILLPIFFLIYQSDNQTNIKYKGFVYKIIKLSEIKKSNDIEIINQEEILIKNSLPNHGKIFLTAYKSFNDNKIFGNGLKSFRYKCNNFLKEENSLCSTHPHNYHLEVLHDTGLVGFIILSLFVLTVLFNSIKFILIKKNLYYEKLILSLIVLNFLIEIFPIKSTGSLFTTWNGTLLWASIALINVRKFNYSR
jgi:O-antigen ligase